MRFTWQPPLHLAKYQDLFSEDIRYIEDAPGVYYFSRSRGEDAHPFYIGKSMTIRTRLKQHYRNQNMTSAIDGTHPDVGNGARFFHFAYYVGGGENKAAKAIDIAERAMIKAARDHGIQLLLNVQHSNPRVYEVLFNGSRKGAGMFPNLLTLEV